MLAQKTYWIQCFTSSSFESMDAEEHAALVSNMRSLAKFCGINVLTYRIEFGNLSMLVSCPSRQHHMEYFQDQHGEPRGSGAERLFKHLRNLYTASYVEGLAAEYDELLKHGEDIQPFWERYTRRIGTPKKFAEGVNEGFARWIKKNRPQLYTKLDGNVCRKDITQTYLDQLHKQREVAARMDGEAVEKDAGSEPRKYWCGYSDALRGDEDAMDGLREIMRSPANSALEIKELGYCNKTEYRFKRPDTLSLPPKTKSSRSKAKRSSRSRKKVSAEQAADLPAELPPPEPMSRQAKLKLMGIAAGLLIILLGVGGIFAMKEWSKYQTNLKALEKESISSSPADDDHKAAQSQTKGADGPPKDTLEQSKMAEMTAKLYEKEARQLAEDFGMCSNPQIRLKMSRSPDKVRKHMGSYAEDALSKPADGVRFKDVVDLGGIMAARFVAEFADTTSRLICVIATEDGLRVDWDCYARFNAKAIPMLLQGKTKSAELRVFAKKSDYYNFTYRDDKRWTAFELVCPDSDDIIYAYSLRNTTTGKLLDSAFSSAGSQKSVQLTLQLSADQDAHQRKQFRIDRIYAFGWVRPDMDIEDQYRSKVDGLLEQATKR